MVDLKHRCIVGTARSKLTILKRLRALKHPSSKAPLVGVHRIIMDRSSIAGEVRGSQNPGFDRDRPGEPLCSGAPVQDFYLELKEATEGDFGCDLHGEEDFEVARAFGLLG